MARNYQQAKIYMICSNDKDCIPYIGSSCKRLLSQRMNQHRDDYKKWKKGKYGFISSFTLFEKYGVENCYIDLIQAYPCNSNDELRKKERQWINDIKCVNMDRPFRTKEEEINYKKIYYELNKEKIAKKAKEIYECSCGSILAFCGKIRHEKTKKHQNYLTAIGTHTAITESS